MFVKDVIDWVEVEGRKVVYIVNRFQSGSICPSRWSCLWFLGRPKREVRVEVVQLGMG